MTFNTQIFSFKWILKHEFIFKLLCKWKGMVVMKQKNDTRNLLRCLSDVVVKWGEINIGPSVMLGLYEPKVPEKLKTSIKKKNI